MATPHTPAPLSRIDALTHVERDPHRLTRLAASATAQRLRRSLLSAEAYDQLHGGSSVRQPSGRLQAGRFGVAGEAHVLDSHVALADSTFAAHASGALVVIGTQNPGDKMADVNDKVMAFVRDELLRNPGVKTDELLTKAKKLDKSVGGLSVRQFHARYPLQIKRKLAAQRPRRRRPRRKDIDRAAIKAELLAFARAVMAAEGGAGVVDVIGSIEKNVDRILAAAGGV